MVNASFFYKFLSEKNENMFFSIMVDNGIYTESAHVFSFPSNNDTSYIVIEWSPHLPKWSSF